jgi:transposase
VNGDLSLSDRIYECAHCGHVADRDVNAAVNLARWPDSAQPHAA